MFCWLSTSDGPASTALQGAVQRVHSIYVNQSCTLLELSHFSNLKRIRWSRWLVRFALAYSGALEQARQI